MWFTNIHDLEPPENMWNWMTKPKNVGGMLRKACSELTLQVLDQKLSDPFQDEIAHLKLHNYEDQSCLIRKIVLLGDMRPYSYGRVVIPKNLYLEKKEAFDLLGNKLIGETLLYNNPTTLRSEFEFNFLDNLPLLSTEIKQLLGEAARVFRWTRRSVFLLEETKPLLITEIFSEDIPSYPHG